MEFTETQIEVQLNKVPRDVRDALTSPQMAEELGKIGDEHNLLLDDIDELVSQTGLIMLGLVHPNDFIRNIQSKLDLERDEAVSIAKDVNAGIFQPIRQSLQRLHETKSALEEGGGTETAYGIDRHSVLNEIEAPTPAKARGNIPEIVPTTKEKQSNAVKIPLNRIGTAPKPAIPASLPTETIAAPAERRNENPPEREGVLEKRLSGMVHTTREESVRNNAFKSIRNVEKSKSDPYREAIE